MSGNPQASQDLKAAGRFRRFFDRTSRTQSPSGNVPLRPAQPASQTGGSVSSSSQNVGSSVISATLPQPGPVSVSTTSTSNHDILALALDRLELQEQAIVKQYLPSSAPDADSTLDEVYKAAIDKRQLCEASRWTWTIRGRVIRLRNSADKVIFWIDKFKGLGDAAANVDPLHAGVPWAGIRFLLEAVVSERQEMAALFSGLDLVLYMMNRFRLYSAYLVQLPTNTATTSGLKTALVEFYALLLRFLTNSIQTLQEGSLKRSFTALWGESQLTDFEATCDKVAVRTSEQAQICARHLTQRGFDDARNRHADLLDELAVLNNEFGEIKQMIKSLQDKIDLGKLPVAQGAAFDSYEQQHDPVCLENTRVELLQQIQNWATASHSKSIFWLRGMAGTGKSTISRTVARQLNHSGQLGASFFFKRGAKDGDRGNAKKFFTTLAAQLAKTVPDMQQGISDALDSKSDLPEKNFKQQFDQLILKPMSASFSGMSKPPSLVVVLDALDECEGDKDIRSVLQHLETLSVETSIRIFMTSRPEMHIIEEFLRMDLKIYEDIILHEITEKSIGNDIKLFLEDEFDKIRKKHSHPKSRITLPDEWPGKSNIEILTKKAVPLFIFASTVCKFIGDPKEDPESRLLAVLKRPEVVPPSKLDEIYQPILDEILMEEDKEERAELIRDFKTIVGSILCLYKPLSMSDLAILLGMSRNRVGLILDRLQSVLYVPQDWDTPVRLLHLSFADFLLDSQKRGKNELWINEVQMHDTLCCKCLALLSEPGRLRYDLCDLGDTCVLRKDIDPNLVSMRIPTVVSYACQYWVAHFEDGGLRDISRDEGRTFLSSHFLHWIEACTLLGKTPDTIRHLQNLYWKHNRPRDMFQDVFLDPSRLVSSNIWAIMDAPLQIYAFAKYFFPQCLRSAIADDPILPCGIQACGLEGYDARILDLVLLDNGNLLASSSEDGIVKLWDPTSGRAKISLQIGAGFVEDIKFSHNGQLLASCAEDYSIRIWDTSTGEERQKLDGHDRADATEFAFSGDMEWLVSSDSQELKLWDLSHNFEKTTINRHGLSDIISVSVSNQGHMLAAVSSRGHVQLWEGTTTQLVWSLREDLYGHRIALSPDARFLASIAFDLRKGHQTVELQDVGKGCSPVAQSHVTLCRSFFFGEDCSRLQTSHGTINVNTSSDDGIVTLAEDDIGLFLEDRWIRYRGQRLLRLPENSYVRKSITIANNVMAFKDERGSIRVLKVEP